MGSETKSRRAVGNGGPGRPPSADEIGALSQQLREVYAKADASHALAIAAHLHCLITIGGSSGVELRDYVRRQLQIGAGLVDCLADLPGRVH